MLVVPCLGYLWSRSLNANANDIMPALQGWNIIGLCWRLLTVLIITCGRIIVCCTPQYPYFRQLHSLQEVRGGTASNISIKKGAVDTFFFSRLAANKVGTCGRLPMLRNTLFQLQQQILVITCLRSICESLSVDNEGSEEPVAAALKPWAAILRPLHSYVWLQC